MLQNGVPGIRLSLITGISTANQKEGISLPFVRNLCLRLFLYIYCRLKTLVEILNDVPLFIYHKLIRITATANFCRTIFAAITHHLDR